MTNGTGWEGRHDAPNGVATFTAGGKTVTVELPSLKHYLDLLDLIAASRRDALQAQADYLRGAINRMLEPQ